MNSQIKLSKYNTIDFWRVIFTFAIMVFHFSKHFTQFEKRFNVNVGWRIGVEFFFIVGGFLLAYKASRSNISAWKYTKQRYWRLFPEYIVALAVMIVYRLLASGMTPKGRFIFLVNSIDDILMLHATAINYVNINGAVWYLSSILICGYFIYYLYSLKRGLFIRLIAPLSCLVIYSYMSRNIGCASGNISHFTTIGVSFAIIRGFAGMSMGVLSFEFYKRFSEIRFTQAGKAVINTAEVLLYALILGYTFKFGSTRVDFIFVVLFCVCIIFSFSHTKKNILTSNPVVRYLSRLSYAMYLMHIPAIQVMDHFNPTKEYRNLLWLVFFILTLVMSAIVHHGCGLLTKIYYKNKDKIKSVFVSDN